MEVDLDSVPMPEAEYLQPGWQTNHHQSHTRQEFEGWNANLQEIQRRCREEQYAPEDFRKLAQHEDPRERALAESYHHFYEPLDKGDAIRMSWDEDKQIFNVDNGNTRLWVAKHAGLRHIPAYVSAQDGPTMASLREQGDHVAGDERPRPYVPVWEKLRSTRDLTPRRELTATGERSTSINEHRDDLPDHQIQRER